MTNEELHREMEDLQSSLGGVGPHRVLRKDPRRAERGKKPIDAADKAPDPPEDED